jgi:hypothetical protein
VGPTGLGPTDVRPANIRAADIRATNIRATDVGTTYLTGGTSGAAGFSMGSAAKLQHTAGVHRGHSDPAGS